MSAGLWTAVDSYYVDRLVPEDPAMAHALRACDEAGLPPHAVTPLQGRLLFLLARLCAAQHILEIGTLGGVSGIWLARALPPGGRLVTLEAEPRHAHVARENFARAGVDDRVEVREGRALSLLPGLAAGGGAAFDLVFIDADKESSVEYFRSSLGLTRPGSVIVVDNVVREGAVVDAGSRDPSVVGVRRLAEWLASEPRVEATAIQTVGEKGHDGFVLARVRTEGERPS